jgi:hypothetical protein
LIAIAFSQAALKRFPDLSSFNQATPCGPLPVAPAPGDGPTQIQRVGLPLQAVFLLRTIAGCEKIRRSIWG